jgi:LysR family hydrogen peroxide-inducible transcriptional activator
MQFAPHPCTLRQLQYAVAVGDALSFRRAAERCRVSQPALSAQVAELEAALGVALFERDRRRVIVTPAGLEVLARARALLVDADDLVEAARRVGDPFSGTLRVGVIPTLSPYLLPSLVPAIRAAHPKLAVQWVEERTHVLVASLEGGSLDAAILALEADLGALDHAVLQRDPFLLAAPVGHPLVKRASPVTLDELRGCTMLLLDEGHCLRDQALSFCGNGHVREAPFRATSLSTLAQMVAGGAGVTLLPQIAVAAETRGGDLRVRKLAAPTPHRTIVLAWRKRSPMAPSLRTLAATLRGAAATAIASRR